ncbi:TVP38/TMEM64 family protein [soil metagenome]
MVESGPDRPERRMSLRRLLPLAGLVLAAALVLWLFGDLLSFEALRDNRGALIAWRDANPVLAAGLYVAAYVLVVALSLPGGAVMTLAGGFLFGALAGAGMAVVAATAGATAIFLAAKHGLGDLLYARMTARGGDGLLRRLEAGLRENELSFLISVRLVPAFPFFLVNLAPAFLGVRLRNYVIATFLGIIPGTAVYAWIGAGLGAVFERGETPDLGIVFDPVVLGPLLGLALLAAMPMLVKALRRRKPRR